MHPVVPETWVTFNPRFFGEDIVILAFKIANDFLESEFVVNVLAKARRINNGQSNTDTVLFQFNVSWLDLYTFFDVSCLGVITHFVGQHL